MSALARCRPVKLTTQTYHRAASSLVSQRYRAVTHPEDPSSLSPATKALLEDHSQYLTNAYARPPVVLSRGEGMWVWDMQDRKYLDFTAGIAVNALGHGDAGVAKILAEQSQRLFHTSNVWWNEWAGELAKLLVHSTRHEGGLGFKSGSKPGAGAKVFLTNSGTEANEGALKFARKYGKEVWAKAGVDRKWQDSTKTGIVSFTNAFHGRSMGALSATPNPKYQLPFAPLVPGFKVARYGSVEDVEKLVDEDTCAVIVEPIQGEGGVNTASTEFLRALRAACDRVNAVLIYDEIQCGIYRTGSLWSHSNLPVDCHSDIITMAKPLANGYPMGAVLVKDSVADIVTPGSHGTTFGGSALAARLGHHVLSRLSEPHFTSHIKEVSAHLDTRVSALSKFFPALISPEVRGRGLIRGIPFKNPEHPAKIVELARQRGLLILTAGSDAVRLVPSLTVKEEEVDVAMDIVESSLGML